MELEPLDEAGPYRLDCSLGQSPDGEQFLGLRAGHDDLSRPVVVTILSAACVSEPARLSACLAAARAAGRFFSPHLRQIYDLGESRGRHFIASEYVDGVSGSELLSRLTPGAGRDLWPILAIQACQGLRALHTPDDGGPALVHGPFSATRFWVGCDGTLKLEPGPPSSSTWNERADIAALGDWLTRHSAIDCGDSSQWRDARELSTFLCATTGFDLEQSRSFLCGYLHQVFPDALRLHGERVRQLFAR